MRATFKSGTRELRQETGKTCEKEICPHPSPPGLLFSCPRQVPFWLCTGRFLCLSPWHGRWRWKRPPALELQWIWFCPSWCHGSESRPLSMTKSVVQIKVIIDKDKRKNLIVVNKMYKITNQFVLLCHIRANITPLNIQLSHVLCSRSVGATQLDRVTRWLLNSLWSRWSYRHCFCYFKKNSVRKMHLLQILIATEPTMYSRDKKKDRRKLIFLWISLIFLST